MYIKGPGAKGPLHFPTLEQNLNLFSIPNTPGDTWYERLKARFE